MSRYGKRLDVDDHLFRLVRDGNSVLESIIVCFNGVFNFFNGSCHVSLLHVKRYTKSVSQTAQKTQISLLKFESDDFGAFSSWYQDVVHRSLNAVLCENTEGNRRARNAVLSSCLCLKKIGINHDVRRSILHRAWNLRWDFTWWHKLDLLAMQFWAFLRLGMKVTVESLCLRLDQACNTNDVLLVKNALERSRTKCFTLCVPRPDLPFHVKRKEVLVPLTRNKCVVKNPYLKTFNMVAMFPARHLKKVSLIFEMFAFDKGFENLVKVETNCDIVCHRPRKEIQNKLRRFESFNVGGIDNK